MLDICQFWLRDLFELSIEYQSWTQLNFSVFDHVISLMLKLSVKRQHDAA